MGKSQKNYLSIKSKLMAAVAMLLVASFMVVSSTYAWFTLSTAPEVKGIRTTIGANGSLEIALAYSDGTAEFNKENVTSGVGDSGNYATWGNLVDVSDAKYGMDKITLLPSRLYLPNSNVTTDNSGEIPVVSIAEYLSTSPLSYPVYGSDGRISSLENTTVYGVYDGTSQFVENTDASGLRAIGTASGMTKQQSAYRQAKQDVSIYLSGAQTKAVNSLGKNGNDLATVIAAYATTSTAGSTYDITCVANIVTTLTAANQDIEKAIRSYFMAVMAKEMETETDAVFDTAVQAFNQLTIQQIVNGGATVGGYTLPAIDSFGDTAIADVCEKWDAINTTLTNASGAMPAEPTAATETDLRAVLITSGLMDVDEVTINGLTKDEIKADGGMSELLNAYMDAGEFLVQLPQGSGVYSDIAEVTGNYQAPVVIKEIAYGDTKVQDVKATMVTTVPAASVINLKGAIPEGPTAAGGGSSAITDYYGYAIDLVFRTNASNSNLMLQTTPTQRIYSDSTNQQTLGSGSKMIFAPGEQSLSSAQMQKLMSAIRIVFTTKEAVGEGSADTRDKIVAIAGLDVSEAVSTADGGYEVSVKLLDYDWTVSYATDGTTVSGIVLDIDEENKFKANDSTKENNFAQKLMALNQNEATVLTAIVYIDGDCVDNADVATKGVSLNGSLSLQFSSDAELVAMKNTELYEGTGEEATTAATTTEATTTEETTVASGN